MNCRKCGCLILETDERCPMCDAKQRGRSPQKRERVSKNGESSNRKGIAGVLGVIVVVAVAFLLVRQITFESSPFGSNTIVESDGTVRNTRFPVESAPMLWDFNSNDLAMINQMNRNKVLGQALRVFVAEDAVYMMTSWGDIIRTTDYFESYELLLEPGLDTIMFSFHVINGDVYYTTSFSDGRYTPNHVLYRYNFEATHDPDDLDYLMGLGVSNSTRIVESVFSEVIINNLVFYKTEMLESNLYLFDMETGENHVLIDRLVRYFLVDYENGQLFFADDERHLYRANLDGTNQERLFEGVVSFAFNGELLAVVTLWADLYVLNVETNVQQHVNYGDIRLRDLIFVGHSIVARDQQDYLYLVCLDDINDYWAILENISPFASIGNHLIFTQWDEDDINRMDLSGQLQFVRPRWER